jgi:diacylglycerol O-acyltransferase / wax synthase
MDRIAGKDAVFLWSDTPTTHMQMAFVGTFDPSTIPGAADADGRVDPRLVFDRFRSLLADRLHLVPRLRQRVVHVPLELDNPYFVDDPEFDLDHHVHRLALPAPGGQAELEEVVARLLVRPIDPIRPLWEMFVIEGLEGGRWAYVGRAHHVMVDGVGGNDVIVQLLDLTPEPREVERPDEPFDPPPLPDESTLLRHALVGTARKPIRFVQTLQRTAGVAVDMARWSIRRPEDHGPLRVSGPRTFLNGPVGPDRQLALGEVSLDTIKAIKREVGCTVNDVVLAAVGRGLRGYLLDHEQTVDRELVAAVPISIRAAGDTEVDNQVTGMTVPLYDGVADLREQLQLIQRATRPAKEQLGAVAATVLMDWSEHAVPALAARAFRFYTRRGLARRHPPIANITLSNVPGPPVPLYLAGSRMEAMYPIGPVIPNQRLNLTVVSYLGTMFIGVNADARHLPPVSGLVRHVEAAVDEMVASLGLAGAPA